METKTNGIGRMRVLGTLIGLICAGAAGAQQPSDGEAARLPLPRTQRDTCVDVAWAPELIALYPRIGDGCQEVVTVDGRKWARFDAEFQRSNNNGTVVMAFKDRDHQTLGDVVLRPSKDQRAKIEGQTYRIGDLQRGQDLNVYVPERIFAAATEPGVPVDELAEIVIEPRARLAGIEPAPEAAPAREQLLAQVSPGSASAPRVLPNTAGPLPLLALSGALSMLGGAVLLIRRRFFGAGRR
jgi:hypothetical protein